MPGPWPWVEENGVTDESTTVYSDETIAVFTVLREWFFAMEAGKEVYRLPDPAYPREFTSEQLDKLVNVALDEWFENTANANHALNTRKIWHDAAPEFRRLAPAQRLALAQDLHRVLLPTPPMPEEAIP